MSWNTRTGSPQLAVRQPASSGRLDRLDRQEVSRLMFSGKARLSGECPVFTELKAQLDVLGWTGSRQKFNLALFTN